MLDHIGNELVTKFVVPKDRFLAQYLIPSKLASLTPEREPQICMPFAGDLSDNKFAAYKAEMVRWKCILKAKKNIKAGCDTFNRFIHQLLCIENTKEQLPDMNFCAILYKKTSPALGGCCPADPLLTDSFFLATPLLFINMYALVVEGDYSRVTRRNPGE